LRMSLAGKTLAGCTAAAILAALSSIVAGRGVEAPVQPIQFSHRVHAGENRLACLYCHAGADRSAAAGVPAVETCYECHRTVKAKNGEIAKVFDSWQRKQPIRWTRVYSLPQHVYFSHKRHVLAGVACETCHGAVAEADTIARVSPLTMGWCVDCHEQRRAPTGCETCHK